MSIGLACAAAVLFLATLQAQLYNDGVYFEEQLRTGRLTHLHLLNLPLMALLQQAVSFFVPISAETAIKTTAALAGGIGVGLTHRIGCRLLDPRHAVAAALLLALLPGYWFHSTASEIHSVHTACAMLLFAGLLRGLDPSASLPGTLLLVGAGALLSPTSHGSGVAGGLAALFVLFHARRRRIPIALAGLLGFGLCFGLQQLVSQLDDRIDLGGAARSFLFPFQHPDRIPELCTSSLSELLILAVPAATFMPAGLRQMARSNRPVAWVCGLWMLGYFIVTFSVYDRAMGSYFLPVFPVHAILAIAACRALGRSVPRWILALGLALLPIAGLPFGDAATLPAFAVCAAALAVLCRAESTARSPAWILAVAAGLVTSIAFVPKFTADPMRERIRAVAAFTGKGNLMLVFAPDAVFNYHWAWHFPGTDHHAEGFVVNPYSLDIITADAAVQLGDALIGRIRGERDSGKPVWIVDISGFATHPGRGTRFRARLEKTFRIVTPNDAPTGVHRVELR